MDPPQEQQVSAIPISSTQSRGSSADGAAAHRCTGVERRQC